MMDRVLDEYEDKAAKSFKHEEVGNTLTIVNKYFIQTKDEEKAIKMSHNFLF